MKTTWRDSWKVAQWEVKQNITNKSFLISIFITPVIFLLFAFVPGLINGLGSKEPYTLYVKDALGVYPSFSKRVTAVDPRIVLKPFSGSIKSLEAEIKESDEKGYVVLDESVLESKEVVIYTGGDRAPDLAHVQKALSAVLQQTILERLGVPEVDREQVLKEFQFNQVSLVEEGDRFLEKYTPGIVAAIILFGVVTTGMMTFQSSMQEKKDKISELLLSSISAGSLMQGKIIGYFLLGIFQVAVWLLFGLPAAQMFFGIPVLSYLMVGKFLLLLFYALAGYLLFSAIFVSMGATVEDIHSSGNFQGLIFMIPFLPFFFIRAVVNDPNGLLAKIGSFIPLTTPGIMVLRLSVARQVPALDVVISVVVLVAGIWLAIQLAGKIFRVGMLLYGKNATPREIWKWIRQ